jgi:hypothetical protein
MLLLTTTVASSQSSTQSGESFDFSADGVQFYNADSTTRIVMRFRMQNWITVTSTNIDSEDEELGIASTDWKIRRLRLRFGGHVYDPRLTFNLQLSFSRDDLDWTDTKFPNVIRDAMVFWNFTPRLQVGMGQTKLPGNRQRVISSADLETPDRSIVNGTFSIDRDFGFQGFWNPVQGDMVVNMRASLSTGEGRNQGLTTGSGLCYSGRVELLPLGAFTSGGDYFEGDLLREKAPRLSIGLTASHNDRQLRNRGQLGVPMYAPVSSNVFYADALLKYRGLSVYGEYATRTTGDDPITVDPNDPTNKVPLVVGHGVLGQVSYILPCSLSFCVRYALVDTDDKLVSLPKDYVTTTNAAFVTSYYINRHRIKANLELGSTTVNFKSTDVSTNSLYGRINLEFGI